MSETLRDLFASHRLEAQLDGDWVLLPRGCRARVVPIERNRTVLQLDVVFEPWTGTPVIESCVGFGETRTEQEADAWRIFATGSLPVLLAAFFYDDEVEVRRTMWEIDGLQRPVTIGATVTRGDPPELDTWWEAARDLIEDSTLPEGTHWIRLVIAQEDAEVVTEVLLDSEPWAHGQAALSELAWPASPDYYSARIFLVLQGGLDVGRAVADLIAGAGGDDTALTAALLERGVDETDAAMMVGLIPIAFGRVMLAHLEVPFAPEADLTSRASGASHRVRLEDQPIFTEATWFAERGTLSQDQFLAIALRSPELRLIHEAEKAGTALDSLALSPAVVTVP